MTTKPGHIRMDINQDGAEAALVRVVKHRLYGLISVFLSLESSPTAVREALRVAVHQGDDLGVALVLNAITGPSGAANIPNHALLVETFTTELPVLKTLAQQLHFDYIADRIGGAIDRLAGKIDSVPSDVIPADKKDIFNQYFPYRHVSMSVHPFTEENKNTFAINGRFDPISGYSAFQLESIYSSDPVAHSDNTQAAPSDGFINQCAIDRVDLATLSVGRFYAEYVLLNRPVMIHRSTESTSSAHPDTTTATAQAEDATSKVWRLENLLKRFGNTQEVSSTIPYSTLFGHKEVSLHFSLSWAFLLIYI